MYIYNSNTYSKEFTYSPMNENIHLNNIQPFLTIPMMQNNMHTFM